MKIIRGTLDSAKTAPSPEIACWIPESNPNGVGILIFPGGGYGHLATHEGEGYAQLLCDAGIACFVVSYRLGSEGHRHPAMLEDSLSAVATIRERAKELGINPNKIGVMGSSAGGHLAAHTLVAWEQYASAVSLRPDFGILCYPVIVSEGQFAHQGSMQNLAGENPPSDLMAELSCDKRVSARTPPCFIWHTGEDASVPLENSMLFASALRQHGIAFELHLYNKGRHGLGVDTPFNWIQECLRWIKETTQADIV